MIFERRSDLEGKHAILSPSQCGWLKNCSEEAIYNRVKSYYAAQIGTIIHDLARELIDKRIKINKHDKKLALLRLLEKDIPRAVIDIDSWYDAFMTFVNDAIALDMSPEVQLIFSPTAFGTSDAVSFDGDGAAWGAGFFLLNRFRDFCKIVKRPRFNKDGSYNFVDTNKTLTLYHDIDSNFILNDLFSKIRLVFGE